MTVHAPSPTRSSSASALEQPAPPVRERLLDLAAVASRRADGYDAYFEGKGVELARALESITVAGDPGRLEQIVDRLLSNALRCTCPGATATLSVRREGTSAVLEVVDPGVGSAPRDRGRVFDRLWRGGPSRSRAARGSCIGLAVVEELARAHAGSITVERTPGEGSRLRVRLPARGQVALPTPR